VPWQGIIAEANRPGTAKNAGVRETKYHCVTFVRLLEAKPMRTLLIATLTLLLAASCSTPVHAQANVPPAFEWSTATPESQGMSSAKLNAMKGNLAARKTTGLLIIRNDKIVYEWYAEGNTAATKHFTASMSKAIVAGVAVGVALTDGRLALDEPASK
jgi:CubicO group peptidase (beta-lactamase class C family)